MTVLRRRIRAVCRTVRQAAHAWAARQNALSKAQARIELLEAAYLQQVHLNGVLSRKTGGPAPD